MTVNYRQRLREEMKRRVRDNSRYSIRAFARDLGITHSSLLNVFNHDLDLNADNFIKVANKLKWESDFIKKTLSEFARKRSRSAKRKFTEALSADSEEGLESVKYHKSVINLGKKALTVCPESERLLTVIKIPLDEKIIKKIHVIINATAQRIIKKADEKNGMPKKAHYCIFYIFPDGAKK